MHHGNKQAKCPAQKKGPLAMSKRPKSREETPKEGSDSARRYRTATICGRAAQSASIFPRFPMQKSQAGLRLPGRQIKFHNQIQWLDRNFRTTAECRWFRSQFRQRP
jgi:hypothetical protein